MRVEQFLVLFQRALAAIRESRFFDTERGFQGALIGELKSRLDEAAFPGDPIVEQEYQKTLSSHGINIRPDLIIHIPFERGLAQRRSESNFVAIAMKLRSSGAAATEDFIKLELLKEKLLYPITIFLNIDSLETHARRCPANIAAQTVCFAVQLRDGNPVVVMERCSEPEDRKPHQPAVT